jgi:hypothetical protein
VTRSRESAEVDQQAAEHLGQLDGRVLRQRHGTTEPLPPDDRSSGIPAWLLNRSLAVTIRLDPSGMTG